MNTHIDSKQNKFLYFLKHERPIILLGLAAGVVLAALYALLIYKPLYSSEARLFIRNLPKDNVITEFGGSSDMVHSQSGYSNPLFNYREMLASGALAQSSYETLSEKYPEDLRRMGIRSQEQWTARFPKMISTKVLPSTDIIKVSFKWNNAKDAGFVFEDVLEDFRQLNLSIQRDSESSNREYLDKELARISGSLDDIRQQIKDYRQQNKAIDISNESEELTRARVELEKQLHLVASEAVSQQSRLKDLSSQLGVQDASSGLKAVGVGNDPLLIKLSQDLALAQQNQAMLTAKFKDTYPAVIQAKSQVENLKASIEKRKRETLGGSELTRGIYDASNAQIVTDLARAQADRVSLQAQMSSLQKGIRTLQSEENRLPMKKLGLDTLEKQEQALQVAYEQVSTKQMEALLKEKMIVNNIVMLNRPSQPTWIFSDLAAKILACVLLGLLGGMALAWLKYDIEDRWQDGGEIETLTGQKVLGSLPWLRQEDERDTVAFESPKSLLGIAYGNMANSLMARSYMTDTQTIAFLATASSRKDSPIIHNLAATLSRLGKSVILIDADFENPGKLRESLDLSMPQEKDLMRLIMDVQKGLRLNQLTDQESIRQVVEQAITPVTCHTGIGGATAGFDYLAALNEDGGSNHEMLALPAFRAILEVLKKHYEFILLDSPSKPLIYPEMQTVANVSDGVVLVSSLNASRQDLIAAINEFKKNGTQILGVITREKNNTLERLVSEQQKSVRKTVALKP